MCEHDSVELHGSVTTDGSDPTNDDCDCDSLPDGVPCFSCYADGAAFSDDEGDTSAALTPVADGAGGRLADEPTDTDARPLRLDTEVVIPGVGRGWVASRRGDAVGIEAAEEGHAEFVVPERVACEWAHAAVEDLPADLR